MEINVKTVCITFFIVISTQFLRSQEKHNVKDFNEYGIAYLIGMMDDYSSRRFVPEHQKEKHNVTYFFYGQKEILDKFKTALKKAGFDINDFVFEKGKTENPITTVYSKNHYHRFNTFYKFKKASYYYTDDKDNDYRFYFGRLKKTKLRDNESKLQFLRGAFVRYGLITEKGTYQYTFSNSSYIHNLILKFLHKTKSKVVRVDELREVTPGGQRIVFIPSTELKKLLD